MTTKGYDENKVVRSLVKNFGVSVNVTNKSIVVARDSQYAGNGTWGKIDYLVHYCGYTQTFGNPFLVRNIDTDANQLVNIHGIKNTMKQLKVK